MSANRFKRFTSISAVAGYSLMELLVTVSIITIVTSIALPSYQNHVMRSHRSDAMAALMRIAGPQEKFYLQNNSYTTSLVDLDTEETENDYYDLQIVNADTATFTARATPKTGGPQVNDESCATFQIDATGNRTSQSTGGGDTTSECWR